MIFIGGIQPKTTRVEKSPQTCPHCYHTDVYLKRTDHFIALFFIPLIRIKKGELFLVCENCGTPIEGTEHSTWFPPKADTQQCGFCGKPLASDFSYCPYCGKAV